MSPSTLRSRQILVLMATLALLGASAFAGLTDPPLPVTRASARAVRQLKGTLASSIDPQLPAVPFEQWVADTFGREWSVSWKVSIGHGARERVLAEDRLYVEVIATPRTSAGEVQLAMLVGTFGGLRSPRLDYGSYWRTGRDGCESGWLADLWRVPDTMELVVGRHEPTGSDAIGSPPKSTEPGCPDRSCSGDDGF
jgi:hypothetical protein